MSQKCEICGKAPQFGQSISHAHNVTKRRFNVNLQKIRVVENGQIRRVKVCTSCIRTGKIQKP